MTAAKYRDMTDVELEEQARELKTELFNLRFQHATGQLSNPLVIRECRRNIARVKTILYERQARRA